MASLSLTNIGDLEIFFIGSGNSFSRENYHNNIIIIKGDTHLVVDFGTCAPQAINYLGVDISSLKNFHITHLHSDHIGGLEEAALIHRYVAKTKPNLYISQQLAPMLWEHSLRGGLECNECNNGKWLKLDDYFNIVSPQPSSDLFREGNRFDIGAFSIQTFRTCHFPSDIFDWKSSAYSTGLLIDDRILFTGDSKFDPDMIEYFENRYSIEAIFHDVQFGEGGLHATLGDLISLPKEVTNKIYLMHLADNWHDFAGRVEKAGMQFAHKWASYLF